MNHNLIIVFILFTLLISCKKEVYYWNLPRTNPFDGRVEDTNGYFVANRDSPKTNTLSLSDTSVNEATISGEINFLGSSNITSYGHCWSTKQKPTLADYKTDLGSINSVGFFSSKLTKLLPYKEYYVRAYAVNSFGVSYGKQILFKTKPTLYKTIDCENLFGLNTFVYQISPSFNTSWYVGEGYKGKGLTLTESSYGGFVDFSVNLENSSHFTFWTKSINPGSKNMFPEVTVDGEIIEAKFVKGSSDYTYWMQLETQTISSGIHNVKINFNQNSSYNEYYLDEIEFWSH